MTFENAEDIYAERRYQILTMLSAISKPDGFMSSASDTHIVFGEAEIEDSSSQLQTQAAEQFKAPDLAHEITRTVEHSGDLEREEDEEVDESGIKPQDIEVVMIHAGVSRSKAVLALRSANGDIVNAILELAD